VASSADGTKLVALTYGGPIYISTNSGTTWIAASAPAEHWRSVASSADGTKLVAVSYGPIYTSADAGATWMSNSVPNKAWEAVASSADGSKLTAAVWGHSIYTSHSTPTASLNITPSGRNIVLSWIVPSMDFVLQQNADLTTTNWTDVTTTPTVNLTNLQNQLIVPLSNSNQFYRLKSR
jgi:photosystem II stability/assembly factor-like uncharacterized protein